MDKFSMDKYYSDELIEAASKPYFTEAEEEIINEEYERLLAFFGEEGI